MTVISQESRIEHLGDAEQTVFVYDFRTDNLADMVVYVDMEEVTTGWVMDGLGDPTGGNITFDDPPPMAVLIVFMRVIDIIQGMDYHPYDPFPAESHEENLDRLTMICQQLQEEVNRSWQSPPGGGGEEGDIILPPPDPGKTLVWRPDGQGFDNAPGIGTFIDLVERSEAAEAGASASQGWAQKWAQEDHNVPIEDGVHPLGYSAYHWAQEAAEGGILDVESEDELMMVVNTPEARYRSLEMIHGTPGGMVKLDQMGMVPLENLPFTGNLRFITLLEGHNRCPKYDYEIPDETACVEPDTRNPSERIPSIEFDGGDYCVIVACDEEPLLNQMNLINPETGNYEIRSVQDGDAVIWLAGDEGLVEPGWYYYPGFAEGAILATDVIFDDAMTNIKGVNVQLWNQAADAVIDDKVDTTGDTMTGELHMENHILFENLQELRWMEGDAGENPITIMTVTNANTVAIGGMTNHEGNVTLMQGNEVALLIGDNVFDIQKDSVSINVTGEAPVTFVTATEAGSIFLGAMIGSSPAQNVSLYQGNAEALLIWENFLEMHRDIRMENASQLLWWNAAHNAVVEVMDITTADHVRMGGITGQSTDAAVIIFQGNTPAINISDDRVAVQDKHLSVENMQQIQCRNGADDDWISIAICTTVDTIMIGGNGGHPITAQVVIQQGNSAGITISELQITFHRPTSPLMYEEPDLSGPIDVDLNAGNRFQYTLNGPTTLYPVNAVPDQPGDYTVIVDTQGFALSFSTGLYWDGGVMPLMDAAVWKITLTWTGSVMLVEAKQFTTL